MVSIQDIAREAGVSVATVSRVINKNNNVRSETELRVWAVMDKHNYHPNFSARNLRKMETRIIFVLLSTIVNPFLAKVVKGIEDASLELGFHAMICNTYDNSERDNLYLNLIRKRFADGAIIIGSNLKPQELRKSIGQIPMVQCSEYVFDIDIPRVTIDNRKASFDATEHLINMGRKKIAHITVKNNLISTRLRLEGYKDALQKHGICFDPSLVIEGNYGYSNAYNLMSGFFAGNPEKCDAVYAISDRMAAGAMKAAQDKGMNVPDDIAVVGFDNIDIGRVVTPSITTVSQNEHEMGVAAMNMLAKIMAGKETCEQIILDHTLIKRASTTGNN